MYDIKNILNKVLCEEALESLKKIPDNSIDLIFIDPPYNVGKNYGVYKDNLSDKDYISFIESLIIEFNRISKKGFGIYLDWKKFKLFWNLIPNAEPIIIFKKSTGVVFSKLKIVQHHHVILTTATVLKSKPQLKSLWDDIRVMGEGYFFNEEKFGHPAQTSLKATKRFIEYFSNEGDIILDCFMGVGTTAVASKELNRNFIGFELNPQYIKITNDRLKKINTIKKYFKKE